MSIHEIEKRIQREIVNRRVKLYEYFQDKDPSRSGFTSWNHFQNCLSRNLDINLTPGELQLIKDKFDTRRNETFNYRLFCKYLEGMDAWYDHKGPPLKYDLSVPRPLQTHTPVLEDSVKGLLQRLHSFYYSHSIDAYSQFKEVDRTKEGIIPFGQLLRILQVPNDFNESEVKLLIQKYQSPEKPGCFDYVTFHNDLEFAGLPEVVRFRDTQRFSSRTSILDLPPSTIVTISIKNIIDRIMRSVYKNNVHLYDYLNVYDESRSGTITEKQFAKGLRLAVGTEAGLTQDEFDVVANFFRNKDGCIPYREFCNVIDGAFIPPFLEKNDTGKLCRMDMGHPKDNLRNRMTEEDERILQSIVQRISHEIDTRQLQMTTYFEECENKTQYPGLITASDFSRVIQKFDIQLSPGETQLLCRRYEEPSSGGILYNTFLNDVDRGFQRFRVYQDNDVRLRDHRWNPGDVIYNSDPHQLVDVYTTLKKIRQHVLEKRLRVSEYFRDYDYTRTGSIPEKQFIRGLDMLLVGAFNQECRISPDELFSLITHYRDPTKTENILWRRFELDVDAVFVTKNLEKHPGIRPQPADYVNGKLLNDPLPLWTTVNHASVALEKLRLRIRQNNVDVLRYFQDFDKCRTGRVTGNEFDRTMLYFNLRLPQSDLDAIKIIYTDKRGFNYIKFVDDLQPEKQDYDRHAALLAMLKARLAAQQTQNPGTYVDLVDLLFRLRTKMKKSRLILFEYLKDHDKQNRNRLSKNNFRRALNLATFELSNSDFELLENSFECADNSDQVDLVLFYDTINSVVSINNLEKSPLANSFVFQTDSELANSNLGPEEDKILWSVLHRIGRRLRQRPMYLKPFFEDMDVVHTGFLSRTQFRRVLSAMYSHEHVMSNEEFDAITKRFRGLSGPSKDVNYRAFLNVIEHISRSGHSNEFWQ